MKIYLDSTVLVAAITDIEPFHQGCAALLLGGASLCMLPHAISETFATLIGGRLSLRLSPAMATRLIEVNLLPRISFVPWSGADQVSILKEAERRGVRGGAIYDSLHLAAARKAKTSKLATLNLRHYQAFHRSGDPEIFQPMAE
jgi:predicted nucleic acid-binding protein